MPRQRELRLTHLAPSGAEDVLVTGPCDTVGDLSSVLTGSRGDLVIDGALHAPDVPLAQTGIRNGSVLGGPAGDDRPVHWSLRALAGPAAGTVIPLSGSHHGVGRAELADPTVSLHHFTIERSGDAFRIADAGSTNGTAVDGVEISQPRGLTPGSVITAGASQLVLEPPSERHLHAGPTRHHRPPRRALPAPPPAIALPTVPAIAPSPVRFSWAAVAAPLLLGLGMALLFDWRMAAFALLSPMLGVGTWLEDKRRARHDRRAAAAAEAVALATFLSCLASATDQERTRREAFVPGAAACISRAHRGASELWERRQGDADFGAVRLGRGHLTWQTPLEQPLAAPAPEAAFRAAEPCTIHDCAIDLSLDAGEVIGIHGERAAALAVARSLVVQMAVLHGPADLLLAAAASRTREAEWDWVKWLPHHVNDPSRSCSQLLLTVVDGAAPPAHVRSAIVIAESRDLLPAWCTQIVSVDHPPLAGVEIMGTGERVKGVVIDGVPARVASDAARALAALTDPEVPDFGAAAATLTDVVSPVNHQSIRSRWAAAGSCDLVARVGCAAGKAFSVDLVNDGPHALVAGTTGAGKSELLRTLVASLAASYSPEQVAFFLIDYKGGSAFDACAALPHVVGNVTDLDEDLAERALISLEAELKHRERRLRAAGVSDVTSLRVDGGTEPMPRLVIVTDEFASLRRDLPDFVDALVQIAQRGRSLGIHLVLATQRPQGVISDSIRANTNLRICLRVQDAAESHDVIGSPDAAALSRTAPGAAIARVGLGELTPFQVAYSSGSPEPTATRRPFLRITGARAPSRLEAHGESSQLDDVVAAVRAAAEGLPETRKPWRPPLPTEVDLAELPAGAAGVVDDPSRQLQEHWCWRGGAIQFYGVSGAGTSASLAALAVAAARSAPPDDLHIYALDFGAGGLRDLAHLPHTGAVIAGGEIERVVRCIGWLHDVVERRRATPNESGPRIVVLVDRWGAFAAAFDTLDGLSIRDRLMRVITEGAAVGVEVAFSGESPIAIPASLAMSVPSKLVFRLADRHDYAALGVASREPIKVPGRCVDATTGLMVQVATLTAAAVADASDWPAPQRLPHAIRAMPQEVKLSDVLGAASSDAGRLHVPVGVLEDGESPALIELGPGEHSLIIGCRGSGRSTALSVLAEAVSAAAPGTVVIALAPSSSPLATSVAVDRWTDASDAVAVEAAVGEVVSATTRTVLLVDDADRCRAEEALQRLVDAAKPHVHLLVATRPDFVRNSYGHWLQGLRSRSTMLLLRSGDAADTEAVAGRPLPRRPFVPSAAGRGELVTGGGSQLVQVALP